MALDLRPPETVMRLDRLGVLHQCRLSFMRQLTRRMASEGWTFSRPVFEIDARGVGHAVYTASGLKRTYSLVAFGHDLPASLRSDRVIAEAWDATFALFDGVPTEGDIARLSRNVPRQEAGRVSARELTLSRANRSVRLWKHVVERLARGLQPDAEEIARVGYLMRTTAVYGSGKFGAADRDIIADRPELRAPFQAEMLTVFLIRAFVRDLVEHVARANGGAQAVRLDPALAQSLGIGNSTGLGMAPFLINHPRLLNNWITARETAIARVRSEPFATSETLEVLRNLLSRTVNTVESWRTDHPVQASRLEGLRSDLPLLCEQFALLTPDSPEPWDGLLRWTEDTLSPEGQELAASLVLEPYGALVDDLTETMADDGPGLVRIEGAKSVAETRTMLETAYGWAFPLDWAEQPHCARAWYVSEEKLEPRLGERFEEPISKYEQPLAPARDAAAAYAALNEWPGETEIATVLRAHPEHRAAIRRAQIAVESPYAEIRDNTIAADMLPIDMLRAKLSFFGATQFDPRSDRWVRICMYAGAPYPETLDRSNADHWVYPRSAG